MIDLAQAVPERTGPSGDDPCDLVTDEVAIVALAVPDWDRPWWVDRQHLLSRLAARGWNVIYTGGIFSYYDRGSHRWNKAGLLPREIHHRFNAGTLIEYLPGKLETAHWRLHAHRNWVKQRFVRRLKALAGVPSRRLIAYVTHPRFRSYLDELDPDYVVLHVNDAWPRMRGWTAKQQADLETLVKRADLIIAVGQQIAASLPLDGPERAQIVEHGMDEKLLERQQTAAVPEDLHSVTGPRIGYFGRISQKIDFQVILDVARARPAWQWVILGIEAGLDPADGGRDSHLWRACRALPNVHFLGRKSSAELPLYMSFMDALVLPYKTGSAGYWTAVFPLKLFECFASGKPVVAADIPAVRPYGDLIALARTQDEWVAALDDVLHGGDKSSPGARISYARDNTWQQRSDLLDGHLRALLTSAAPERATTGDRPRGERVEMA